MLLTFRCERCGKELHVDDRHSGRKGRCKYCGLVMMISGTSAEASTPERQAEKPSSDKPALPPAEEPLFRLSPQEPSPRAYPREEPPDFETPAPQPAQDRHAEVAPPGPPQAREAHKPEYGIELIDDDEHFRTALPVSPEIERGLREMAEFARDPRGYSLATPRGRGHFWFRGRGDSGPPTWLYVQWKGAITRVLKLLRWIDNWAYLISVPFLVLLVFAIVVSNRALVHLGAVVVVLVNYGRFWTDLLALFVRPFKEGPLHGLAFLFPPYGLYYLATRWTQVKPTLWRLVTSCIPIVLVVLAYAFLPSVNPGVENVQGVGAKIEAGGKELVKEIHEGV